MPLEYWKPKDPLDDSGVVVVKIGYQGGSAQPIGQIEVFFSKAGAEKGPVARSTQTISDPALGSDQAGSLSPL